MALFLAPKAFLIGMVQALTSFRLLTILYLFNLFLAAPAGAAFYHLLASTLAEARAADMLLHQHDPELVADYLRVHATSLEGVMSAVGVTAVIAFLVHIFLQGGLLTCLADRKRPRSLMTFFSACGRCFFPFLRVWVPGGIALFALFVLNQFASSFTVTYFDDIRDRGASAEFLAYALLGKTALMILLAELFVLAPIQLARCRVVIDDQRGMLRGYLRGLAISIKNPLTILAFSLLFTAAGGAIFALHHHFLEVAPLGSSWRPLADQDLGIDPALRPGTVAIIAGQLLVLLQQAVILLRVGGFLVIYREKTEAPPDQDPELVYARPTVVDAPAPRRGTQRRAASLFLPDFPKGGTS